MGHPQRPATRRSTHGIVRPLLLLALLGSSLLPPVDPTFGTRDATAAVPLTFTSIDTMKESRDTETRPLTDAQIADDVDLAASLSPAYITVDTHYEYPDYMRHWVQAIRATGRHVWFRIHPNQWGNNNGTSGIMSPQAYEDAERAFLQANASLFQPSDILDPCPEPENGLYWQATYGYGWTGNAPNTATREYNAFIRATSDIADATLHQARIYGVITTVRSTNSFFATHPGPLEPETVARMGRVTVDSYPEGTTTDPATAAAARLGELQSIEAAWGVPVVIGELGYSNRVPVDDRTQAQVLAAEFQALATLPYLEGLNYWVGAGTDNSGGYTHLFAGGTGTWTLRPAAAVVGSFFASGAAVPSPALPSSSTPTAPATPTSTTSPTPTTTVTASETASATLTQTPPASPSNIPTGTPTRTPSASATPTLPPSATSSATQTGTSSPTSTSTPSATSTQPPTSTANPAPGLTQTPTSTSTAVAATATQTGPPTASPTATASPSAPRTPTPSGNCPPGWHCADIGSPALPGSQSVAGGIWSVTGGGEDIWGTASQFRSVWRAVRGDRALSARVLSQSVTSPWAKAGVILSRNADPDSPYYALFVTPEHGVSVQYRALPGGNAADLMIVPGRPPVYLRVARSAATSSAPIPPRTAPPGLRCRAPASYSTCRHDYWAAWPSHHTTRGNAAPPASTA